MRYPFQWALLALAVIGLGASMCLTQEQGKKDAPRQNLAEVRLGDGSLVRVAILQDNVDVMTRYGKLTVPFAEIRRIDFGLHLADGVGEKIDSAIKQLGSDAFRERDDATRELVLMGGQAYPSLQRASRHPDMEVAQRAVHLMKRIGEKVPADQLRTKEDDVLQTAEFPVVGRIINSTIKASSVHFGELSLKLSDLRTLHMRGSNSDADMTVDSTRYGSDNERWLDTGITLDPLLKLQVTAEGQVDLWPQGPGQYMTTPKGYTTAGKGVTYMAGTLLGRVGDNGKIFVIGERYDGAPGEEGRLFLHIVPSPWNNASAGAYQVHISTENVGFSSAK
jgi:hypothetical protein